MISIVLRLPPVSSTQRLNLTADLNEVFVGSRLTLTCSTPSTVSVINWHSTLKGSINKTIAVLQEFVNGTCRQTTHTYLDCNCDSATSYTCAINSVTLAHDGQGLRCSAIADGTTMHSNEYNISVLVRVSTPIHLQKVDNMTTANSFTIKWQPIKDEQGALNVLWRPERAGYWNSVFISSSDTMFTQYGLQHGTKYEVKLVSVSGQTQESEIIVIETNTKTYERIHVIDDSISENAFTVEWTLDNKAVTPLVLNLLWRQENKKHWNSVSITPNDTMFTVQGLQHGTKYEVKLLSRGITEHATESDIIKIETKNSIGISPIWGIGLGGGFALTAIIGLVIAICMKCHRKTVTERVPAKPYDILAANRRQMADTEHYAMITPV